MWKSFASMTFALGVGFVASSVFAADTEPSQARQREIIELLREDCGSCHGMTLRGGLGPPLTPQALANKPSELLRATILNGRAGTPMAPWSPFLSDAEAAWLTRRLKQGIADGP